MKCLIAGHSHIGSLERAYQEDGGRDSVVFEFFQFRKFADITTKTNEATVRDAFLREVEDVECTVLCIQGNEHNTVGLLEVDGVALPELLDAVRRTRLATLSRWLDVLAVRDGSNTLLLAAPPPIGCEEHLRRHPGVFEKVMVNNRIRAPEERLALWRAQLDVTSSVAKERELGFVDLPPSIFSSDGLMASDCYAGDPTHGNRLYARRVLAHLCDRLGRETACKTGTGREVSKRHFYVDLPDSSYWKQGVAEASAGTLSPMVAPKFVITRQDKVAAAGSCFAQHILRRLEEQKFNCLVTESPMRHRDSREANFSARYGNIYTSRQLLQLFDRAYGEFVPEVTAWERTDGRFCDPFRPTIEPAGYATSRAVDNAMNAHLAAVRTMFESLDVFVFTLGLTECWRSRQDGAVYPVAPGVAGGNYDPAEHEMLNLGVQEVTEDLNLLLTKLKRVNPDAKVVLTVSPVPLVATATQQHVLQATVYSKSVLRVAAEDVADTAGWIQYFPSYEIIIGPHARGDYFGLDRRSVTEQGVDHVMRVFFLEMTNLGVPQMETPSQLQKGLAKHLDQMQRLADAACDEELLAQDRGSRDSVMSPKKKRRSKWNFFSR